MKRDSKRMRYLSLLGSTVLVFALFVCVGVSLRSNKVQSETHRFPIEDSASVLKQVPQLIATTKSAGLEFQRVDLFEASSARVAGDPLLRKAVTDGSVLNLNQTNMRRVLNDDAPFMTLPLPDGHGGTLELELVKVNILAPGFSVKTATGQPVDANTGAHYRGIVKGDTTSLAAISVFENEVMGFFSTRADGNSVLGRLGGYNPDDRHILYADKNLQASPEYGCDTEDTNEIIPPSALEAPAPDEVAARCIRMYLEADYDIYLNKGSNVTSVSNYLTGMFNQSAAIFANEGVPVAISEIFVWNTASPYTGTTTSQLLQQFRTTRTTFNGDLAHFLAIRNLGGIAYVDVMCNRSYAYGVSSIHGTFQNVPTYSWTVDVFTHETGHNIASPHTHSCAWNGNGTAIDGCYTTEGGCPNPGVPAAGGTIMSYCHLQSVGKNFTLGFGPQPRALMVNRFNAVPCLTNCASTTNRPDFDFDGDGKSDISVFRASDGGWHLLRSGAGYAGSSFGVASDALAPADYDGDGRADHAVFRPSTGTWYLQRSTAGFTGVQFGQLGDVPMPGDFDGDDKADLSVFRPSNGSWYRINSGNGQVVTVQFGQPGDVPVMGDFDGDGRADQAVFRPSTSSWYLQRSTQGFTGVQFGVAGDVPVAADYDGDGKTDIAVYRPLTGAWYLLRSQSGLASYAFGISTDRPAPADYDGDGKADIAVFRPSAATWYLQQTTAGFSAQQFGVSTDKVIPAAFLP